MTTDQKKIIEKNFYNYKKNLTEIKYCPHCGGQILDDGTPFKMECSSCGTVFETICNKDLWSIVFVNTAKKYKWQVEENIMTEKFINKKQQYNICSKLKIKKRTYFYYLNRIYETAYMWAKELMLL